MHCHYGGKRRLLFLVKNRSFDFSFIVMFLANAVWHVREKMIQFIAFLNDEGPYSPETGYLTL